MDKRLTATYYWAETQHYTMNFNINRRLLSKPHKILLSALQSQHTAPAETKLREDKATALIPFK